MNDSERGLRWLLNGVLSHPANRGHALRALSRFLLWQIWKRIVGREITVRVGENRRFLVVPDSKFSSQVVYTGLPDWDEMNFLLRFLRPSDRFLDIGANVGFYSVLASTRIVDGHILAVEANPRNSAVLKKQISINNLRNVTLLESALGEVDGEITFVDTDRETGTVFSEAECSQSGVKLPCMRLDTLIKGERGSGVYAFAKMDVEGSEMMILRGAIEVLKSKAVRTWIFELSEQALRSHGSTGDELMGTFREHGYTLHVWSEEERVLLPLERRANLPANVIACSDLAWVEERCRSGVSPP